MSSPRHQAGKGWGGARTNLAPQPSSVPGTEVISSCCLVEGIMPEPQKPAAAVVGKVQGTGKNGDTY